MNISSKTKIAQPYEQHLLVFVPPLHSSITIKVMHYIMHYATTQTILRNQFHHQFQIVYASFFLFTTSTFYQHAIVFLFIFKIIYFIIICDLFKTPTIYLFIYLHYISIYRIIILYIYINGSRQVYNIMTTHRRYYDNKYKSTDSYAYLKSFYIIGITS